MSSGYFDSGSMIQRVHRERALGLYGPRALLMQAAHPLAVSGLLAHTTTLDEPYDRLARTAEIMNTIYFGTIEEADSVTSRVRKQHSRVSGRIRQATGSFPAGTPYRADQADLLLWVLFTLVDSGALIYRKYVGAMTREQEAAYWEDYRVVGSLFGLADSEMPATLDDLRDYRRDMLEGDVLHVTDWARERARSIVLEPPVPRLARPLLETVNFVTVTLLPDRIRREYGFRPLPPAPVRRALVAGGAEYVKRAVIPFLPNQIRLVPAARAA